MTLQDEKKYIEWLLHNDEHMKQLQKWREELDYIHDNYEVLNDEDDEDDEGDAYSKKYEQVGRDLKKLITSNYYYDSNIDAVGNIYMDWENMLIEYFIMPTDLIHAIENEIERRVKRKRKYPTMWRKLHEVGLIDDKELKKRLNK